jgi:tRNA-2-methylthio-N6-dimethylallyladenosine synthase
MRKLYIKTFGCQMNVYDSERIVSIFKNLGYETTNTPNEADYAIINTCSVREKPQHKVDSELGRLKKFKNLKIGVCGCVAQQEGEKFLKNYDYVDFVFGTDAILNLYEIYDMVEKGHRICNVDFNEEKLSIPLFNREKTISSYVTIMKGCDNFCSYCIVPYVRGREKSRAPEEVIKEVEYLVENGVKEITLLGQNVNSYGKNLDININFPQLLSKVESINGLERLRFITSHPKDFSDELINTIKNSEKICEYLHLPLQAGSNSILKTMNRKYSYEEYKDKILKAKSEIKNLAISSDFIVGFPGETDEDFIKTINAIKEIEYETIFAFKYSVRPGTKAEKLKDDVPEDIKNERLNELLKVQEKITKKLLSNYVGKKLEVLVEGKSRKSDKVFTGRSRQNRVINFDSNIQLLPGTLVNILIKEAKKNSLYGIYEEKNVK